MEILFLPHLRTMFIWTFALAIIPLLSAGCGSSPEEVVVDVPEHPNLILISIDTLRADFLGCYGYDRPTSPSIDRFATQSVLFENAVATAPWTPPSHASMLTGLYPSHHGLKPKNTSGIMRDAIRADIPTIAEVLQGKGYQTAAFVRGAVLREGAGFARGFDDFVSMEQDHMSSESSGIRAAAETWLTDMQSDAPFFLFLHFYDVHSDYNSLPEYEEKFTRPYVGVANGTTVQLQDVRNGFISFGIPEAEHLMDLYCAGIRQMDDQFAGLMKFLDDAGLSETTMVVLTSDHGEEFLEHGSVLHGRSYFEELVHVPLIVRGPGIPSGRRVSTPVSLVDIMPTAFSLLNVTSPSPLDGIDLRPLWAPNGTGVAEPRFLFSEADWGNKSPDIKRVVRYGNHKLHLDRSTNRTKLYNLADDPDEYFDIANESSAIMENLRAQLEAFMKTEVVGPLAPELTSEELEELESLGYID